MTKSLFALLLATSTAHADAMLTGPAAPAFPERISIAIGVRAQIESTTIVLELPPITAEGTYQLTVPAPPGGSPIGVDIARGEGWSALPAVLREPSPGSGGSNDPALVAWQGTAPLVATLEEVEPGPLTVRVRFVRLLRRAAGQVAFQVGTRRCPARRASDPGARVSLELALETGRDLTTLHASGAHVEPAPRGGRVYTGDTQDSTLVDVRYAEAGHGIGVQLVAHRTPSADPLGGDAGYFVLLVDADPGESAVPRALSLVIDRSGSMAGAKIAQARDAARAMLDYLRPTDAFTIHVFDDDLDSFRDEPVPATPANIAAARDFIKGIRDDGSTNLHAGLQVGLSAPRRAPRFDALVLLSDGLPTSGETDTRTILAEALRTAAARTRIFTFSVGRDADFPLMEALARGSRGRHVDLNDAQATRDLVARARELFEDIRDVRLTDLEVALDGIGPVEIYPEAPPDLFAGGQVILVGRYTAPGTGELRVTGFEGELPFETRTSLDAPALRESDDIIKYVWAHEKVRALAAAIAGGGDEQQLRAEIEALGVAYRIQTPYTSYAGGGGDVGCGCGTAHGPGGGLVVAGALGLACRRRRARRKPGAAVR